MVDVTAKQPTVRSATASGRVVCGPDVVAALRSGGVPKGDVLAVARIAGHRRRQAHRRAAPRSRT